jgi:ABC-type multidrug transport system fused ATPase/permease subunit
LPIEEGRVAERGTHAEFLERGGLYADLYPRQFRGAGYILSGETYR